jgi:MFS family permease
MLGIALLAAPAGLVLVVLLAGRVVDRAGSRAPTLAGGFCAALLPVALGLAGDIAALMAALFAFGLATGMLDVAMNAQAVHIERGYGRPLMSSFHACFSFGGLAGALFGGVFAWAGVGPAVNFLAIGAPLAVVALVAGRWLLREREGQDAAGQQASGREAAGQEASGREAAGQEASGREAAGQDLAARGLADRDGAGDARGRDAGAQAADGGTEHMAARSARWPLPVLVLGLLSLFSLLAEGSADGWSAVYLHDSLRTSAGFAALGYAAFSVMMAFGRLTGDRLAARFGPVALVRCCGLLAAAGLAGALISADPAGALAGFAVFGAGLSCIFPQLLSASGSADPLRPGRAIARVAGMGYLGVLGGPVLIGGIASVLGLPLALGVPVILALCIAAGAGQVAPRRAGRAGWAGRAVSRLRRRR